MNFHKTVLWCGGLLAAVAWAQKPATEAEASALTAIRAQRADGLIAVQPWTQLLGVGKLGGGMANLAGG